MKATGLAVAQEVVVEKSRLHSLTLGQQSESEVISQHKLAGGERSIQQDDDEQPHKNILAASFG
jgi:hypothetical protein